MGPLTITQQEFGEHFYSALPRVLHVSGAIFRVKTVVFCSGKPQVMWLGGEWSHFAVLNTQSERIPSRASCCRLLLTRGGERGRVLVVDVGRTSLLVTIASVWSFMPLHIVICIQS
jgi:hypothetical protein